MSHGSRNAIIFSLIAVVVIWSINGIYLSVLSKYSAVAFWCADLVQWVVIPTVIFYYLSVRHEILPVQYGLSLSDLRSIKIVSLGIPVALTFYPAFFWVRDYVWQLLGYPGSFFSLGSVFPDGTMGSLIWLYSALTAGLVESAFFIGLPWLLWSSRIQNSAILFSFLSSLVFAEVHWEQGLHVVVGAFVFNLVACAWYFRLRTLWPVVSGHVIVDLISFY